MSQDFLTLEGSNPRRRKSPSTPFGFLELGERLSDTAAFKAAAARENKAALIARQDTSMWVESDEAGRQNAMAAKLDLLTKDPNAAVTEKTPDLFSIYSMGECSTELGFFNFKRMFTPPARIRNIVKRIVPRQVTRLFNISTYKPPKPLAKALRYAGALNTLPLTLVSGKMRNKMFGLTGGEQKFFDHAAKVGRVVAAAVVAVVAAPAVGGAIGKLGASAGAKTGWLKYLGTSFGKKFAGNKLGSVIMKDLTADAVWKVAKNGVGAIVASKINKNSVSPEDYAALPNNVPVEVPYSQIPVSAGRGPMNAGAGQEVGGGAGQGYEEIAEAGSEMPAPIAGANSMSIVTQNNPEAENDPAINVTPEPTFDEQSLTEITDGVQKEAYEASVTETPIAPEPTEEEQPGADFERNFAAALDKVKAKEQGETLQRFMGIKRRRKLFAKKVAKIQARPKWL